MSGVEGELLREANAELSQDEDQDPSPAWGEQWKPAAGEHRLARYVGEDRLRTFGETKIVYLYITYPGTPAPFYLEWKTRLGKAMDAASPARGDILLLKRGPDKDVGQAHPMQRWSVVRRSCDDPMPGADKPASVGETPATMDDIPFAPTL